MELLSEEIVSIDAQYCDNHANIVDFSLCANTTLKVLHVNIRSVEANYDELMLLLESFKLQTCDVIILSETRNVKNVDNINIDKYKLFYNHANFNQNDGLIIYVKNTIECSVKNILISENTFSKINFKIKNIKFNITALYRLPSTNVHSFLDDLDFVLNNENNDINILIGDININILDRNNLVVQSYLNILESYGYESYVNKPTRVTNSFSSCIDHIFVKNSLKSKKITPYILQSDMTDHYPVLLNIDLHENKNEKSRLQKTCIDYIKLNKYLNDENWATILQNPNVEEAYVAFNSTLKTYITLSTRNIKILKKNDKLKPWMTIGLLKSIRKRDKLKQKLIKHAHNENIQNQYKTYRNYITRLIKIVKKDYYSSKLLEIDKDSKKTWETVKEITNDIKSKNVNILEIKDNNGKKTNDKSIMVKLFNEYFTEIGVKMGKSIPHINNPPEIKKNKCSKSLFLTPITSNDIVTQINSLKKNSAPGIDGISGKTLKIIHTHILKPLEYIFNLILTSGIIPDSFKTSVVVPIHKGGDNTQMGNYRPISLINNICKVFEKCLKDRIMSFLYKNDILYKYQFGFRPNLSTEDALFHLTDLITNNMKNHKKSIAIFLDLAKAFDTVSHSILLKKLENIGIRGLARTLIKNYLTNRKQYVKIDNHLSESKEIQIGVPQGTVLGPLLFLIYLNDLGFLNINGILLSYADDTVLLVDGKNWLDAESNAELSLKKVHNWLNYNGLSLNHLKTKFITFSPTTAGLNNKENMHLHEELCKSNSNCNCKCITRTENINYLGFIIDQHLNWKEHINKLIIKLRKTIYKFKQIRDILDERVIKIIYYSLVESLLRYGIICWGSSCKNAIEGLEIAQKYILKIIYKKNKLFPSSELFTLAQVLDIRTLYIQAAIIIVHKTKISEEIGHMYETRIKTNKERKVPIYSLRKNQLHVSYIGVKLYNKVPYELRQISNSKLFSKKIKPFIIENAAELKSTIFEMFRNSYF